MKRLLHTLTLILFVISINAQQVLLSDEMLPYGAVMVETSFVNFSEVDITITGPDALWDFSGLIDDSSEDDLVVTIVDPTTTPHTDNFLNSNYAYHELKDDLVNYRYFSLTEPKMERVGSFVSSVNIYDDPQIEYVFPMELGTTNEDTWDSTNSSSGGTYDLECIGAGTLITPGGTFNALMVHVVVVDSFVTIDVYFWYDSDNGAILLTYMIGDGFWTSDAGTYLSSLGVGVDDSELITDVTFNNPVSDDFRINLQVMESSNYTFSIMNSMGQMIHQSNAYLTTGGLEHLDFDFSTYSDGLYFFNIKSSDNDNAIKTIKIVKS